MNTKNISIVAVASVALAGVSFYGGMKYQESKISNFQNLMSDQRQEMFQQGEGSGTRGIRTGTGANIPRNGTGAGINAASGEVIAKDDKSITVKLRDGGSKIVFFSDKTIISKTAEGSQSDITAGEQVMVTGTINVDGSVTAALVQLRPSLPSTPSGSSAPSGSSTPSK